MAEKRRGLGRGLGALISGNPAGDDMPSQTELPGPSPAKKVSGPDSDALAPSDDAPSENSDVSRGTIPEPSAPPVSRETSNTRPTGGAGQQAPDPSSATGSEHRKPASETKATKAGKTSPTRSRDQARKPRPVDMFFASNQQESTQVDREGDINGAKKPSATNRNRRVAVPDVLGQVMQQKEDKGASSADATGEGLEAAATVSSSTASGTTDDVPRETLVPVPGATFAEVPVGDIHPNRKQPRNAFDEEDMAELVHSIREVGLLQPIVIRPSDEENGERYELVMGERRWRAVQASGLATIPAIIRNTSNTDLLRDALLENLHRSQLNPLEEAAAYQQLLQEFDCTQDELSERIGRSRPQISNTIRLMKLPALVQRRVAAGVLSAGHARALLGLADSAEMEKLAQRIVNEGLSVRATEEIVAMNDGLRRPAREKSPRSTARHERLDYLANSLSDQLDTSVKITLGAKKGRVSIEFGSVDDLNRIMNVISPNSESK